ncbi:hypothetical protein ACSSOE_10870 [Intestinibacter bartlettii]|jgi:hypothetical protein|uniref:hypothetical protein n=1 Tax=Intestinibacter bartlettii TaxID=261299 RepID=UPI00204ABDFB|nr:MAG TPA: hypothetical protein [Caudoviricetes sp.]
MYEAVKEITNDLIKKKYIKSEKDIALHVDSKLDQYCFRFSNPIQRENLKQSIIENALKGRLEVKKPKVVRNRKKSRREGRSFIVVDFCKKGKIHSYNSLAEGCRELKLDQSRVGDFLRGENYYYLPRKRKWIINTDMEENEVIIENLEEIVENARELYEVENKCEYTGKMNMREAIDMAIKITEERIKNEYRF